MFTTSAIYKASMEAKEKIIVNQGGTASGKTYTILQLLFTYAMLSPRQVITVVGQDIPNLKKGAYRDAKNIYASTPGLSEWFSKPNETDRVFTCKNGSVIEFTSYQDEQDAKSGKRDYLFINEANGISYSIYWQLYIRTAKKVFIDYNPTARFWVHDKLLGTEGVKLIISDHRHNPFISEDDHNKIESIPDKELWRVYARGLTGKIEGLIYNNWSLCDAMPEVYKHRFIGIDFGFTNDPTAIIDVRLSDGELWIDEIEYKTGLTNPDIHKALSDNNLLLIPVIADSAEPKSIQELRNMRVRVEPAQKGPDSIKNGIDILRRYKLNITRQSINVKREISSYKWKEDKSGNAMNVPIDGFNHAMDAIRYVALNKLYSGKQTPLKNRLSLR